MLNSPPVAVVPVLVPAPPRRDCGALGRYCLACSRSLGPVCPVVVDERVGRGQLHV